MSKDRVIVNEVILVGKVRKGKEDVAVPVQPVGVDATPEAIKKFIAEIMDKYQFTRSAPGLQGRISYFYHTLVAMYGNDTQTFGNKTLRLNKATTKYGWFVVFQSQHPILFDELKAELVGEKFEFVGYDDLYVAGKLVAKNGRCKIRLTEFGIQGFWDEFAAGFAYNPHNVDPETGKATPMMAQRKDRVSGKLLSASPAVSRTLRHFVLAEDVDRIESLRDSLRDINKPYKITEPEVTDEPSRTESGAAGAPEPVIVEEHLP